MKGFAPMIDYKEEILKFYYEKLKVYHEKVEQYYDYQTAFRFEMMNEAMIQVNTIKLVMQRLGFTYEEVESYVESQDAREQVKA